MTLTFTDAIVAIHSESFLRLLRQLPQITLDPGAENSLDSKLARRLLYG